MAARTWVESVRCLVRALTRPWALQVSSIASSRSRSAPPAMQAGAELAEHGEVEAGVGQLQAEGVLPVDAAADGVGGLAIGEPLGELQDGDQGQPPGGLRRPSPVGEQGGEAFDRRRRCPGRPSRTR